MVGIAEHVQNAKNENAGRASRRCATRGPGESWYPPGLGQQMWGDERKWEQETN